MTLKTMRSKITTQHITSFFTQDIPECHTKNSEALKTNMARISYRKLEI